MATFNYIALGPGGKQVKGTLNADSERHVRRMLKDDSLVPLEVRAVAARKPATSILAWRRRLKSTDTALILRQLATLLQSGLALDDCLKLMAAQSETPAQKQLTLSWRSSIVEGQSLSSAMRNGPSQMPENVLAAIAVGEETGHLEEVMNRLADDQERLLDNRQTLQGALVYPALIITVAVAVLVFVMINIVPKVTEIFVSQQVELPAVTRAVIAVSHFLSGYGLLLLLVLVSALAGLQWWLRRPANKCRFHQRLLRLPTLGHWLLIGGLSDWCRGLALLLASGVPAVSAMTIANASVANLSLRQRLQAATEQVRQGMSVYQALVLQPGMPGFMLHMIGSGEASSELDKMLMRVADYYSKALHASVDTLLKLLNPLLLIIIALIVMVIILGVLTPIMQMNRMI